MSASEEQHSYTQPHAPRSRQLSGRASRAEAETGRCGEGVVVVVVDGRPRAHRDVVHRLGSERADEVLRLYECDDEGPHVA